MLERKISDDLLEWKRSGTGKALLLTGARQIGKSYAVREFAKHEYAHYLEINLYENKQAARALASANDVQEFISRLTLFSPSTLIPGDTLIFIDEVQEAPDVMTMVKFLVADGRFDYVFSGSMLGTELARSSKKPCVPWILRNSVGPSAYRSRHLKTSENPAGRSRQSTGTFTMQ